MYFVFVYVIVLLFVCIQCGCSDAWQSPGIAPGVIVHCNLIHGIWVYEGGQIRNGAWFRFGVTFSMIR